MAKNLLVTLDCLRCAMGCIRTRVNMGGYLLHCTKRKSMIRFSCAVDLYAWRWCLLFPLWIMTCMTILELSLEWSISIPPVVYVGLLMVPNYSHDFPSCSF